MSDANPKNKLVGTPEWESVRQKLKGNWIEKPMWCCSQLKSYLGNISDTSKDKIKVVMNYLVSSAFRTGKINHPCTVKLRTQLSMERKKRVAKNEW
jgi:hypothetical protein